jgi:hypothetical protein
MTTSETEALETIAQISEFRWPPENRAGRWESLEPLPRPLGGVEIDGRFIRFKYRKPYVDGRDPLELGVADFRMLKDFAELCAGDSVADGRLLRFTSHYGALGLCKEHNWPFAHTRPLCPAGSEDETGGTYVEPIDFWLTYSRVAAAIIRLLLAPRRTSVRDVDLEVLKRFGEADERYSKAPVSPYIAILHWLKGGEIRLWFRDRPKGLTLYGVPGLWTALGLELAAFAVRAKGIILCSSCGRIDAVKHPRASVGRRSYCSKCRVQGRKRDAAADLRGRRKRTRELRAQGKSIVEITRELGLSQEQVKRYLGKE